MRHLLLVSVGLCALALPSGCAKKERTYSHDYIPVAVSADALPAVSRRPTNPEGGRVPGKLLDMDPEESMRRKIRNEVLPVTFGLGAAGITMQSTRSQARGILAAPIGTQSGFEFYPEHIRIQWGSGSDNPMPALIVVDEGYPGSLQLPVPYDTLSVGESMSALLNSPEAVTTFMRTAGAQFEGMDAKTYSCEEALTCRLIVESGVLDIQFRRGGIVVTNDAQKKLQLLYFAPPQKFYPRLSASMVYGTSIGGVSFLTTRSAFEKTYGPPEALEDGVFYYDRSSIGIAWGLDQTPLYIAGLGTLQSTLDFGTGIGARKMGDSFSAYFPDGDDGSQFMLQLDRFFENRSPDFDCSAQAVPLCSLKKDQNLMAIQLAHGTFVFTAGADRKLLLYQIVKE